MTEKRYKEIYEDIDLAIETFNTDEKIDDILYRYIDIDEEEVDEFMTMWRKKNK